METQTPIILYAWLASLKKWTGKLVVKKKYMVCTGCLLLVLSAAWTAVAVYESAREGKAKFRQQAEETLRDVGRLVVTERFDSLDLPVYISDDGKEKNKFRSVLTAKGFFEVAVDSLKEKQGLYSLKEDAGTYAHILMDLFTFPLDELQKNWQRKIPKSDVSSYLVLRYTPLGTDSVRVDSVGDASIARLSNKIGDYYVDDFYTTVLTAYACAGWKEYVDWGNHQIVIAFLAFLLIGIILFVGLFLYRLTSSAVFLPVKKEELCRSIGKLVYHAESMELTCEGRKVDIQPQPLKLFCAFMRHGGYLSYADINEALGWHESALGLDSRRKKAISTLRTVLREKDERLQIKHEADGYRIFVTD